MWTILASYNFDPAAIGQKQYLPTCRIRRCRFCLRDPQQTSFTTDAHAIPELFGNRYLLTLEECDECNRSGSTLEDDLAKHLTVTRSMARIQGKAGDVKHRFGDRSSSIASNGATNLITVVCQEGDDSLRSMRIHGGIRYVIRIPGYRPINVVRALARMALMIAPENELAVLEHIRRWLRDETQWAEPTFDEGFVPGTGLREVKVTLWNRKPASGGQNHYSLAVFYSSTILLLHLPDTSMVLTEIPTPPRMRSPWPPHDVKWTRTRVNTNAVFRGRTDTIDIAVPALIGLSPPSHEEIAIAAYYRWQARGAPSSSDGAIGDWLNAEQDLLWKQVPFDSL
jgi:hypothetical protein